MASAMIIITKGPNRGQMKKAYFKTEMEKQKFLQNMHKRLAGQRKKTKK